MTVKRCVCCGTVHTRESWSGLKLVGEQDLRPLDVDAVVELRDCSCGSTLGVQVAGDDDVLKIGGRR